MFRARSADNTALPAVYPIPECPAVKAIPTSFKVLGHTISVLVVPSTEWEHSECGAYFSPESNRICVRKHSLDSMDNHAFWHEVVHAIFHFLNRETLYTDELLVDNIGAVLAQIMDSAE